MSKAAILRWNVAFQIVVIHFSLHVLIALVELLLVLPVPEKYAAGSFILNLWYFRKTVHYITAVKLEMTIESKLKARQRKTRFLAFSLELVVQKDISLEALQHNGLQIFFTSQFVQRILPQTDRRNAV